MIGNIGGVLVREAELPRFERVHPVQPEKEYPGAGRNTPGLNRSPSAIQDRQIDPVIVKAISGGPDHAADSGLPQIQLGRHRHPFVGTGGGVGRGWLHLDCDVGPQSKRVGGNSEIVKDELGGFLIPAGNPQRMADAIARLGSDADLRGKIGRAHV